MPAGVGRIILELDANELARIRALAFATVEESNRHSGWFCHAEVRRTVDGALIRISYRSGKPRPADPLGWLGELADQVRSQISLEKTGLREAKYRTEESRFESGDHPVFYFQVWPTGAGRTEEMA